MSPPRCVPNNLQPVSLDKENMENVLADLQATIAKSLTILRRYSQVANTTNKNNDESETLYTGNSGIALMFLRIAVQYGAAGLEDSLGADFRSQIPIIIGELLQPLKVHHASHAHVSPLATDTGPALVYILASLSYPSIILSGENTSESKSKSESEDRWAVSTKALRNAVQVAIADDSLGGDEVLYGRAGLLWGMLNLRSWLGVELASQARREDLNHIAGDQASIIEDLINEIMEAGDSGSDLFTKSGEYKGLPLMWQWHGKYYLGAIHGVAGILTVVLQAPRKLIMPHLHVISSCIDALCTLVSQNDGHLPSSLPAKPHSYELVQICHGSPGFLLLLATFRACFPQEWHLDWNTAEALASERVWKDGLITKGIGVCHGLAGNAWPWLLQAHARKGSPEADVSLSRALAFLLHSRELPLLSRSGNAYLYRISDHPYSLFEGLAGTVCAWMDACVIIRERLAVTEGANSESIRYVFGIPGLGGAQVHSIL
ncbi:hypothetical protein EW145_g3764 [Phellinidium pouzarii]|uniref:Lanthionine synthetase C family protein n=1 Tax=Phellinidium pouzarii TaxID=167371 RepID=A0A4V3XCS0_9AGAM|nr:hypothetical protein EW145_g3764 [Phellinidium pouzarii]